MQRVVVRFVGRVQGVGFRATTRDIARRFPITGWVRNEPDGSVCLEAQGEPREIDAFLDAVRDRLGGFIRSTTRDTLPALEREPGFEVRR